ncbi:MAG: hypothetical protein DCC57_19980 [Chloroflexi bacterium]|nr:MAG: hypothetical protein DCC57_19980 [Chloroflexota bacterium]
MWVSGMRSALVVIDAFVALTAIGGGVALAAGLEANRFPLDWLQGTPFHSYLIPGLILAGVVGGSAAVAAVVTLRAPRAGGLVSVLAGVILMGQITGELVLLNQPAWSAVEVFYFALGLVMVALGLFVWRA